MGGSYLERESCWDLAGGLVPREHGLLLGYDDLLLRNEVVERVDEAPVEVALPRQGAVVHVSLLRVVVRALQKSVKAGIIYDNCDSHHRTTSTISTALFVLSS